MRPLAFALALLAIPAAAQPHPAPGTMPRTVTVAGDALVEAAPDRAVVRIGVVTEGQTAEATLSQHEQDVERVLTAVRGHGIADRAIEIAALALHQRYGDRGRAEGYTATRVVAVTVDDLRLVPEIVAAAVSEGANRLDGLVYTLRDADRFEDQALAEAFARARAKAERLAAAAGLTVGRVVEVHEQGVAPPMPPVPMPFARAEAAMDAAPGAYSAGTTEVRAAVVVTFALAD